MLLLLVLCASVVLVNTFTFSFSDEQLDEFESQCEKMGMPMMEGNIDPYEYPGDGICPTPYLQFVSVETNMSNPGPDEIDIGWSWGETIGFGYALCKWGADSTNWKAKCDKVNKMDSIPLITVDENRVRFYSNIPPLFDETSGMWKSSRVEGRPASLSALSRHDINEDEKFYPTHHVPGSTSYAIDYQFCVLVPAVNGHMNVYCIDKFLYNVTEITKVHGRNTTAVILVSTKEVQNDEGYLVGDFTFTIPKWMRLTNFFMGGAPMDPLKMLFKYAKLHMYPKYAEYEARLVSQEVVPQEKVYTSGFANLRFNVHNGTDFMAEMNQYCYYRAKSGVVGVVVLNEADMYAGNEEEILFDNKLVLKEASEFVVFMAYPHILEGQAYFSHVEYPKMFWVNKEKDQFIPITQGVDPTNWTLNKEMVKKLDQRLPKVPEHIFQFTHITLTDQFPWKDVRKGWEIMIKQNVDIVKYSFDAEEAGKFSFELGIAKQDPKSSGWNWIEFLVIASGSLSGVVVVCGIGLFLAFVTICAILCAKMKRRGYKMLP